MKTTILILLASCALTFGQNSEQRELQIKQAAGFRKVAGTVYHPAGSTNWFVLPAASNPTYLKVNQILDGGITVDFIFEGSQGTAIQKTVFIKNFPHQDALTTGAVLNNGNPIVAMRVGVFRYPYGVLESYDYGTPWTPPAVAK